MCLYLYLSHVSFPNILDSIRYEIFVAELPATGGACPDGYYYSFDLDPSARCRPCHSACTVCVGSAITGVWHSVPYAHVQSVKGASQDTSGMAVRATCTTAPPVSSLMPVPRAGARLVPTLPPGSMHRITRFGRASPTW